MRKNCLSYPVEIVENVFAEENTALAEMLRQVTGAERPRIMLVADQNVVEHTEGLGSRIGRWMKTHGVELAANPLIVLGGERAKSGALATGLDIARTLVKAKIGVGNVVVVLGGGTILDVTGWAAAQVRGGIPVVRVPTTPAAMMDGAFAEYAAVNAMGVKDALRVVSKPAGVLIDTTFSETILDGVWRASFAEALRIAVVSDASLVKKLVQLVPALRARDAATMKDMIASTIAIRQKKGATDFALWSAHRLEAMSSYNLPHGYAVLLGICIDTAYSMLRGFMKEEDRKMLCDALSAIGAMEGAMHSRPLLGDPNLVLLGLDAWKLVSGSEALTVPAGLGKGKTEKTPDRDTMKQAINLLK